MPSRVPVLKVPRNILELEDILAKHWFRPEARIFIRILQTCSPYYRRQLVEALAKRLRRKGVLLSPELIEDIISMPSIGKDRKTKNRCRETGIRIYEKSKKTMDG